MAKDALTAHARDELGISEITTARPVQAALTSAVTFSTGAAMLWCRLPVCSFQSCPQRLWAFSLFWVRSGDAQAAQTFCVPRPE
jgi:hypothetical protein